ncbi:MAG: hypothetical protein JST75_21625 [Bacteroidetes bacterium]|nr:hypothetical protein [Bacteroidota bacterium]
MKRKIGKYLFLACVLFIVYALLGTVIKVSLLKAKGKCTKGVLIPELSSFAHRYTKASLVYEFTYEGKTYSGNSLEKDTSKVGDSVCIVYLPSFPSISRPMTYFNTGDINCSCK